MAFEICCPNCGRRPYTEFWYGGEMVAPAVPQELPEDNYERIWLKRNIAGLQAERWYHRAGCGRWFTAERNTLNNEISGPV